MRRIVGIELAVELSEVESAGTTRVRVTCARDATFVEVDDPVTGKSSSRRVDLESTARVARSRLLALAIAELVSASWAELRLRRTSDAPLPDAVASVPLQNLARRVVDRRLDVPFAPPSPPGPIRRVSRARLFALGTLGGAGQPTHLLGGGGFEGLVDLTPRLSLALGLDVLRGRIDASPGDVRESRLAWSGALLLRRPVRGWHLAGGLGARIGRGRLEGDGDVLGARVLSAPFGGAFLVGETWCVLWRRLLVVFRAELGTVTLPIVGRAGGVNGPVVGAIDGAWSSASIGLGVAL